MKISIITVCFNAESMIEHALMSVASQDNANFEHILIDGFSTDKTVEIIKKYKSVTTLVSEPDEGIYDAMNKGISIASGDIVGTLNADDIYYDKNVLNEVQNAFLDPSVDACYGDLVYVKQDDINQTVRFWKSKEYKERLFKLGWMPAHPTFFVRKTVYDRFGGFNLDYKIAADFELLFRFIEQNKIKTKYVPKLMVKMRLGGTTNKSLSNVINQNKEIISVLRSFYPNFSVSRFIYYKIINRISQFVMRPNNR